MLSLKERIINLSRFLLPTGRAFRMARGSNMWKLFRGLAVSESNAVLNAEALFASLIPDNDAFTIDDATDWERRLGMLDGSGVPFADRKLAILRKMAAPGVNPAKGHYLWIQQQLQDAGFVVWVHENIFPVYPTGYTTINPASLNASILSYFQQGDAQQGDFQQGGYLNELIVNSLNNDSDIRFDLGESLDATFFIGGQTLGTYANVLIVRELEFRQLILNLKQVQNAGILFINYI